MASRGSNCLTRLNAAIPQPVYRTSMYFTGQVLEIVISTTYALRRPAQTNCLWITGDGEYQYLFLFCFMQFSFGW